MQAFEFVHSRLVFSPLVLLVAFDQYISFFFWGGGFFVIVTVVDCFVLAVSEMTKT